MQERLLQASNTPPLWACISSPLLHILCNKGYGTKLQQPIICRLLHLVAFASVDDTNIIQTDTSSESLTEHLAFESKEIFRVTQGTVNTWSSILQATGGELEPNKTFCMPIMRAWQGTQPTLHTKTPDTLQVLHLNVANSQPTVIEKKDPDESFFTLGIWQFPQEMNSHKRTIFYTK